MMKLQRTIAIALVLCAAVLGISLANFSGSHAQFGVGVSTQPGLIIANNLFPPTSVTGQAGTVTNPASNSIINISGGPVFCNGNQSTIAPGSMTLALSTTYLIVYNCPQELLYAKTAVVAPGTSSPDQPGVPATALFAIPGVEVALFTVVCNATACSNGGNGSVTDRRSAAFFPTSGAVPLGGVTFANLPAVSNGSVIFCTDCNATCAAGASTGRTCFRENGAWAH